jgi:hypothetical protein
MPPAKEALRRAIDRHVACWNAEDREGWLALFDPGVVFEDPVGVPPKRGLEAARLQWERSFKPGQRWTLGESGKFVHVRGYYDPPAEVDGYFQAPEDLARIPGAR